jgi:hypothetical protein
MTLCTYVTIHTYVTIRTYMTTQSEHSDCCMLPTEHDIALQGLADRTDVTC